MFRGERATLMVPKIASRLESAYGASQIASPARAMRSFDCGFQLDGKLLCGRRTEFENEKNQLRSELWTSTTGAVEIVSYDRVLDSIDVPLSQR